MNTPAVGRPKAEQIRGVPDYPLETLYPCQMSEGVAWGFNPKLGIATGIVVRCDGAISFAPAMVQRMDLTSFTVWVETHTFAPDTKYVLKLRYFDTKDEFHEQYSDPPLKGGLKARFNIPVEHVKEDRWFPCTLIVGLRSPMEGGERDRAEHAGQENPMHPVLVRGVWIEARG